MQEVTPEYEYGDRLDLYALRIVCGAGAVVMKVFRYVWGDGELEPDTASYTIIYFHPHEIPRHLFEGLLDACEFDTTYDELRDNQGLRQDAQFFEVSASKVARLFPAVAYAPPTYKPTEPYLPECLHIGSMAMDIEAGRVQCETCEYEEEADPADLADAREALKDVE